MNFLLSKKNPLIDSHIIHIMFNNVANCKNKFIGIVLKAKNCYRKHSNTNLSEEKKAELKLHYP